MDFYASQTGQILWSVLLAGLVSASIFFLLKSIADDRKRKREQQRHFIERFGSVDRMLLEAEIDRDEIRRIRDADRSGVVKATRLVMKTLDIPLNLAAEFVKRL